MRRRGISLVEVLIGALVAALLAAALWAGVFADLRRFTVDQARIDGLHAALVLDETIARDLARLAPPAPGAPPASVLAVGEGGRSLAFAVVASDPGAPGALATEEVRYAVDGAARTVSRTRGGRTERIAGLSGAELEFELAELKLAQASPVHFGSGGPLPVLKYRLSGWPTGCEALPSRDAARVTVVGAVPVPQLARPLQHPYWNPASPHSRPAS